MYANAPYRSHFQTLDVLVDSYDHALYDLGEVENVSQAGRELFHKYLGVERGDREYNRNGGDREALGMCATLPAGHADLRNGYFTNHFVFYQPQKNAQDDLFVRAHEETHALHGMTGITDATSRASYAHGISLLEERMKADGYAVDLSQYRNFRKASVNDKELVAHLGAFYTMEKEGYDVDAYAASRIHEDGPVMMKEAFEMFQKARGKQPAQLPAPKRAPSLEDRIGAAAPKPAFPLLDPALPGMPGGSRAVREYSLYDVLMEFFQLLRWYMRSYGNDEQKPYSTRGSNRQMTYAGGYA